MIKSLVGIELISLVLISIDNILSHGLYLWNRFSSIIYALNHTTWMYFHFFSENTMFHRKKRYLFLTYTKLYFHMLPIHHRSFPVFYQITVTPRIHHDSRCYGKEKGGRRMIKFIKRTSKTKLFLPEEPFV